MGVEMAPKPPGGAARPGAAVTRRGFALRAPAKFAKVGPRILFRIAWRVA